MAVDIFDRESLERWLRDKPCEWAQVIALRTALRSLTLSEGRSHSAQSLIDVLRAISISWFALRWPEEHTSTAALAASSATIASDLGAVAGYAAKAAATRNAGTAATYLSSAIYVASPTLLDAALQDARALETVGYRALFVAPLDENGSQKRTKGIAQKRFKNLDGKIWDDWLGQRTRGGAQGFSDNPVVDKAIALRIIKQNDRFWNRDPAKINADIAIWYEEEHRNSIVEDKAVEYFISYASRDEKTAREIAGILDEVGYSYLVQFRDFIPGTNFVREMQRGLASSSRLIALLSPSYETSAHCQSEWAAAYAEDPGSERGKIVPFLVQPTPLNPLSKQIVYRSLVGLNRVERRAAILDALRHRPANRSRNEVRRDAAALASPDVMVRDGKLDAVPNRDTDVPAGQPKLIDLVVKVREQVAVAVEVLPENAPKVIGACLTRYHKHLGERRTQPIVGLLDNMISPVRREFRSSDMVTWGEGIADLFENLFRLHEELHGHFPRSDRRERFFAETPIDEQKASGSALAEPVREANEIFESLSEEGVTTVDFDETLLGQIEEAEDLASLPPGADAGPSTIASPKRRLLLTFIGFCDRALTGISNLAAAGRSTTLKLAITKLGQVIEKLLDLIGP